MICRAARTCSALLVASLPGPIHSESSSPTRTLPPIAAACAAIGIWLRPAPSTDQWYCLPNSRSAVRFMCSDVLGMRRRCRRECRTPSARTAAASPGRARGNARGCRDARCRSTRTRSACRCRCSVCSTYSMSLNVLRNTRSRDSSSACGSQSCLNCLKRLSIGNRPKFIEPMLSEATSGLNTAAGLTRSSTVMDGRAAGGQVDHRLGALLDARQEPARTPPALWSGRPSSGRARADARSRRPPRPRRSRLGDLLRRHRQMRRHRRGVDRARDGAGDDDFIRRHAGLLFSVQCPCRRVACAP